MIYNRETVPRLFYRPILLSIDELIGVFFVKERVPIDEKLDGEQRARLWEYRLHVENQLYSRISVFLTYETILLAVVGTLYANPNSAKNVLIVLVVLGVLITLIWLYVQHNVKQVYDILDRRTYDNLPEHRETVKRIYQARRWTSNLGIKAPALLLLTYPVPILILLMWIFLLFFLSY
jgi:hypothetical protein